jgi:hypothetical protein
VSAEPVPRDWLNAFWIYLVVSGIVNLIWEIVQLPFYAIWRSGTTRDLLFAIVHCTAGDLMIASLSLTAALMLAGNRNWPSERAPAVSATTCLIGLSYTVYSEYLNTVVRKSWAYADLMPTVPPFGTGLIPLLQWIVVPLLALNCAVNERWHDRGVP